MAMQPVKSSRSCRRGGLTSVAGVLVAGAVAGVVSVPALAGPTGERVVSGAATFDRSGSTTTITTSDVAIINFDTFNIGAGETVQFVQPGASSRVLNRVTGGTASLINGSLIANGQVYFVNPSGIIFGPGAVINVGRIFAAAGDISDSDFTNGVNRFTDLRGEVVNQGRIEAQSGVHLAGWSVENFGTVSVPDGLVTFSAGETVYFAERGGSIMVEVSSGAMTAMGLAAPAEGAGGGAGGGRGGVTNAGRVDAGRGRVALGAGDHVALALHHDSIVLAGEIEVIGGVGSTVVAGGVLDASGRGPGGSGGTIDISSAGGAVVVDRAVIDASAGAVVGLGDGLGDGPGDGVGGGDGGRVRIGGDFQGGDGLNGAGRTLVTAGSRIAVDGSGVGDGGTAVVWSNGATVFEGSLSARGGEAGGDGGFAEISGLGSLSFAGELDLRAPRGELGEVLFDPRNIRISSTDSETGSLADVDEFLDPTIDGGLGGGDALETIFRSTTLETLLLGGLATVTLQATNDITFDPGVTIDSSAVASTLRLVAGRSVILGDGVTLTLGGSFFTTVNSNDPNTAFGRDAGDAVFSMGAGSRIVTGGDVRIEALARTGAVAPAALGRIELGDIEAGGTALFENFNAGLGGVGAIASGAGTSVSAGAVVATATSGGIDLVLGDAVGGSTVFSFASGTGAEVALEATGALGLTLGVFAGGTVAGAAAGPVGLSLGMAGLLGVTGTASGVTIAPTGASVTLGTAVISTPGTLTFDGSAPGGTAFGFTSLRIDAADLVIADMGSTISIANGLTLANAAGVGLNNAGTGGLEITAAEFAAFDLGTGLTLLSDGAIAITDFDLGGAAGSDLSEALALVNVAADGLTGPTPAAASFLFEGLDGGTLLADSLMVDAGTISFTGIGGAVGLAGVDVTGALVLNGAATVADSAAFRLAASSVTLGTLESLAAMGGLTIEVADSSSAVLDFTSITAPGLLTLVNSAGLTINDPAPGLFSGLNLTGAEFNALSFGDLALRSDGSVAVFDFDLAGGGDGAGDFAAAFAGRGLTVGGALLTDAASFELSGLADGDEAASFDSLSIGVTDRIAFTGFESLSVTGSGLTLGVSGGAGGATPVSFGDTDADAANAGVVTVSAAGGVTILDGVVALDPDGAAGGGELSLTIADNTALGAGVTVADGSLAFGGDVTLTSGVTLALLDGGTITLGDDAGDRVSAASSAGLTLATGSGDAVFNAEVGDGTASAATDPGMVAFLGTGSLTINERFEAGSLTATGGPGAGVVNLHGDVVLGGANGAGLALEIDAGSISFGGAAGELGSVTTLGAGAGGVRLAGAGGIAVDGAAGDLVITLDFNADRQADGDEAILTLDAPITATGGADVRLTADVLDINAAIVAMESALDAGDADITLDSTAVAGQLDPSSAIDLGILIESGLSARGVLTIADRALVSNSDADGGTVGAVAFTPGDPAALALVGGSVKAPAGLTLSGEGIEFLSEGAVALGSPEVTIGGELAFIGTSLTISTVTGSISLPSLVAVPGATVDLLVRSRTGNLSFGSIGAPTNTGAATGIFNSFTAVTTGTITLNGASYDGVSLGFFAPTIAVGPGVGPSIRFGDAGVVGADGFAVDGGAGLTARTASVEFGGSALGPVFAVADGAAASTLAIGARDAAFHAFAAEGRVLLPSATTGSGNLTAFAEAVRFGAIGTALDPLGGVSVVANDFDVVGADAAIVFATSLLVQTIEQANLGVSDLNFSIALGEDDTAGPGGQLGLTQAELTRLGGVSGVAAFDGTSAAGGGVRVASGVLTFEPSLRLVGGAELPGGGAPADGVVFDAGAGLTLTGLGSTFELVGAATSSAGGAVALATSGGAFSAERLFVDGDLSVVTAGGDVSVAGAATDADTATASTLTVDAGAGAATFGGTVSVTGLGMFTASGVTLGGPGNSFGDALFDAATTTIAGDVSAASGAEFVGSLVAIGDRLVDAGTVVIGNGAGSSAGMAPGSLTLNGLIGVEINGSFDAANPLSMLTVNTPSLRLGGVDIRLLNGAAFNAASTSLSGVNRVQTGLIAATASAAATDGIVFGGDIDTSVGDPAASLTLLVPTADIDGPLGGLASGGPLVPGLATADTATPIIQIVGDVGSASALAELNLNFDPALGAIDPVLGVNTRPGTPVLNTIVFGDAAGLADPVAAAAATRTVSVESFTVGGREKVASVNGLTINAPGGITVGDIVAVGDLSLNSPSITVLTRGAGPIFNVGVSTAELDDGVDIIAGGSITIGGAISTLALDAGSLPLQFALPGAALGVPGFEVLSFGGNIAALIDLGGPLGLATVALVDLDADGPTNTNVATSIAGAIQTQEAPLPRIQGAELDAQALTDLRSLGLVVRTRTEIQQDECEANPAGTTRATDQLAIIYDLVCEVDDDGKISYGGSALVTNDRFNNDAVARVLARYRDVFGSTGGEGAEAAVQRIIGAIDNGFIAFESSPEAPAPGSDAYFDPAPLLAWLSENAGTSPEAASALESLESVRTVLLAVRELNLSRFEYNQVIRTMSSSLLGDLQARLPRAEYVEDLVRALADSRVALTAPVGQPGGQPGEEVQPQPAAVTGRDPAQPPVESVGVIASMR